jgi:hypothetical protein
MMQQQLHPWTMVADRLISEDDVDEKEKEKKKEWISSMFISY